MKAEEITDAVFEEVKVAAEKEGVDPQKIKREDISVEQKGSKIHVKWKEVEIEMPAPSQEYVDSWFKENGQVIAGSLITLGAVAVGGVIAIASAATLKD